MTSLHGHGLYRFSFCQRLIHDCKVVEPDIERECPDYEEKVGEEELYDEGVPEEDAAPPLDDAEGHT